MKKEEQYRIRSSCFWSRRDTSYRLRDGEPDAREFATSKRTSTTQKRKKKERVCNHSRWSSHEKVTISVTILLQASANGPHRSKRAYSSRTDISSSIFSIFFYVFEVDGCGEWEATVFGVEVAVEDVINLGIDVMRDRGRSWLSA
ncbi:hypothetical protein V1478_000239 [Vespula squamosa]|uniref:Uncharacterized protein n=1 Tax=Vespula squamosa TaxID=30214 RepID=A0ABD2C4X7_VESSQ